MLEVGLAMADRHDDSLRSMPFFARAVASGYVACWLLPVPHRRGSKR